MTSFLFYIGVKRYHSNATNALVKFLAMINLYLFLSSTTLFELELIKGGTDKNKVKKTQKKLLATHDVSIESIDDIHIEITQLDQYHSDWKCCL